MTRGAVAGIALIATGSAALAASPTPITSVPPALVSHGAVAKAAAPRLLLPAGVRGLAIDLATPSAAELALVPSRNRFARVRSAIRPRPKALAIAFPREVPAASRTVSLDRLAWTSVPGKLRAAQVTVTSPGARALRVALTLARAGSGITLRFAGSAAASLAFGPVPASEVTASVARDGRYWTPVLAGERATIEIAIEPGVSVAGVVLGIAEVSHHLVPPERLQRLGPKDLRAIGAAGSCEIDLACVSPPSEALDNQAAAVARMDFVEEDGYGYLCTGQLLNDSISSNTPYFFTASHCMDSAYAARTLNTYWFFRATTCGDTATPPYVQLVSGARLLARSVDFDWALVRLNDDAPHGARFSAWRAEPVPALSPISVLHHPEGDLLKWSEGTSWGYNVYGDGSSFAVAGYRQGSTEPGSSGAGLLTWLASGRYYEIRGGLSEGDASCQNPGGTDDYSRLDAMLPLTRGYLTPGTLPGPGETPVAEFYNATLDHYFMTADPREIDDLDAGVHPGWERTGLRFLAYSSPASGANPVCRFYRTPGYGDSHFYSASPSECQAVLANPVKYPGWTFESPAVFYIALPDAATGLCPAGDLPVWRFFNQTTTNHRYTSDHTTRDAMRADPSTWIAEGYGPDQVIMCSPAGS